MMHAKNLFILIYFQFSTVLVVYCSCFTKFINKDPIAINSSREEDRKETSCCGSMSTSLPSGETVSKRKSFRFMHAAVLLTFS